MAYEQNITRSHLVNMLKMAYDQDITRFHILNMLQMDYEQDITRFHHTQQDFRILSAKI